jgi:small subunit ribosomal protein S2
MKRFIFTERNGIYIIDLQQSLDFIDRAYEFIKETVAHGGSVLYVGTKKQAQEAIAEQARRVGMPFVNQRWLGGMLTNFSTVYKRLQRLKELEEIDFDDATASNLTKKEMLHLRRERDKLERSLGGIRDMSRVPSALWVVDTKKEHIAVSEARKLGIPVIAILDTNCDPDEVTYPIPGNDDAIRSVALLTRVVADAVADGLIARAAAAAGEEKPAAPGTDGVLGAAEPLAEWERELLEGRAAEAADGAQDGTGTVAPDGARDAGTPGAAGAAPAGSKAAEAQVAAADAGVPEVATDAGVPEVATDAGVPEVATGAAADAGRADNTAADQSAPEHTTADPTAPEPSGPDQSAADQSAADQSAADQSAADASAASETP